VLVLFVVGHQRNGRVVVVSRWACSGRMARPGIGGRAADKRPQARCASHPPFRFAKRHPRATRNACPLTCQLMSKLLMGGVNAEGVVRRTLTFIPVLMS
jgi:hypothetical protein